ncbi:hypothetical protein LCGC14_0696420 [marine sediment metagenome]|uniref:Uncharacterized protein n=1 Tax=marine sediment metagenome TaxID=412755 RepID=A0A0F9QJ29_9ZZZZ
MIIPSELDNVIEITVDSEVGISELAYRPDDNIEPVNEIKALLFDAFPETLTRPHEDWWELIGLTKADDVNYFEDTISVIHQGKPGYELRKQYGVPLDLNLKNYYAIKYRLESKTTCIKVYDANYAHHLLPALPSGTRIASKEGIGLHFGDLDEGELAFRDLYVYHDCAIYFERSMGYIDEDWEYLKYPEEWEVKKGEIYPRLYGVLYDARTLKNLKLKHYVFPSDPKLNNIELI